MDYPDSVNVIELDSAPFKCARDAIAYAKAYGIVGVMSNADTNGKGEIAISVRSLDKMLSGSAVSKSATPALHFAALVRLRDIIRESFIAESHPDFLKGKDGRRSPANGINDRVTIAVLYGCASMGGIPLRVKTTLKLHKDQGQPTKAYSYEITNVEVLRGNAECAIQPSNNTSTFDVNILLHGVCDVNGVPLLANERNELVTPATVGSARGVTSSMGGSRT